MIDDQLNESLAFIEKKSGLKPKLGFVLGSGLSGFAKRVTIRADIPFADIPHFACSSVEGHPGRFVLGEVDGVPVAVMLGRLHAYEGLEPEQVMYPVRLLNALGVTTLVLTNAAGGLRADMRAGDFMVIRDHINLTGINPLRGPNWPRGPRFVDMTGAWDPALSDRLKTALGAENVRHHEGTYVGVMGPTYETAAEIRFFGQMGGGTVGMSTVYEVLAARHLGVRVAGLSCITNLGTGLSPHKLTHQEVKDVAHQVEDQFTRTLVHFTRDVAATL